MQTTFEGQQVILIQFVSCIHDLKFLNGKKQIYFFYQESILNHLKYQ